VRTFSVFVVESSWGLDARAAFPTETDKALPCGPTIACTADIVPAGTMEVEAGVLRRSLPAGSAQWTFPFLLKQSVASWLQLQVGSNGYSLLRGRNIPAQAEPLPGGDVFREIEAELRARGGAGWRHISKYGEYREDKLEEEQDEHFR
jgi:hypothetical protein